MSRTPALAIMSNDVAGSNSRRPGRRHPKHEEALWSATVRVPQDNTYYFHYPVESK